MPTPLQLVIVENHMYLRTFLAGLVAETYPSATIVVATNGAEALAVYHHQHLDLIISDEQMRPSMVCAASTRSANTARPFPS